MHLFVSLRLPLLFAAAFMTLGARRAFLYSEPRGEIAKRETKYVSAAHSRAAHISPAFHESHGNANVSIMEEISEYECCLHGNWLRSHNHSNISPRDCWMTTFTFNLSTFELGRGPRVCLCFNEALLSVLRSAANIFYRLRSGTNGFDKLLPPIRPADVHCVFGSWDPSMKGPRDLNGRKGSEM